MALFSFVDMRTFSVFKCQKCCCLPVCFVARIISWICPMCFFPFPSLLLLPFRKKCALLWRLPFFFFFPTTLLGSMDSFVYFKSGKKRAWLWTYKDLAWKQLSAMEKQISLLLYNSRHLYIKKKIHWKFNKERNWRNSHGKAEFLESDEFSPFHLVNIQQITTAKANMT